MRITADNGYNAAGKPRKAYSVAHSEFANRERYFPAWAVFLVSEMHQKRYVLRLFLRDATGLRNGRMDTCR